MKTLKISHILSGLLVILLVASFYPLLRSDHISTYDDKLLLSGVEGLQSLSDYKERFISGKILDIQPIRDLSYFIDIKIKSSTGLHSFHLTNLLLWIGIIFLLKRILSFFDSKDENLWLLWSLVFLFAFSPVFTSSVAWIAARKHLLSAFFTLWATDLFLRKKGSLNIIVFYVLAGLSQPINVLWPIFVVLYSYFNKQLRERKILITLLSITAILIVAANLYYYQTLFVKISGGDGKYDSFGGLGLSLLAVGRYFYLTIFPFDSLPVSHYQGSWQNLAGLFLLILFLFWCYKKKEARVLLLCFVTYFFIPLIPVTYKITRIFCSDTYLLNASVGIYAAFYILLKDLKFKKIYIPIFCYAGVMFFLNLNYIQVFQNTNEIWEYSYNKEPSSMSVLNMAEKSLAEGDFSQAQILIKELESIDPENRFLIKMKSDLIYNNQTRLDMDKILNLESLNPKAPIVFLRLALLHSNNKNPAGFKTNIIKLFSDPQSYIKNSYLRNEEMLALVRVTCEVNKLEQECKKYFEEFSTHVQFKNWDAGAYEAHYFKLRTHSGNVQYK